ncbi:hypothetical protein ACC763_40890, partial [Rhizobium ruizarguesonis]
PRNGAADTPLPDADAAFLQAIRCRRRLLRFGTASFAAVGDFIFLVNFLLVFFSACDSSPRIAPVLGETVAAIRAKARRT